MVVGQYILDRWMIGLVRSICHDYQITFRSYSDDWILELEKNGVTRRIFGYKFDLNGSAASSITADKVAAFQILAQNGIPAVEHRLVRTKAGEYESWSAGLGRVVIKPLDGTSGHAVRLLDSIDKVDEYISSHSNIAAWAASPYQEISSERRFIVLDGKVLYQYEKLPVTLEGLRMFNLGLGAQAHESESTNEENLLAKAALHSLGLRLAAVDVIKVGSTYKILEVNDGIMMENFMRQKNQNKAIAQSVYEQIILSHFK